MKSTLWQTKYRGNLTKYPGLDIVSFGPTIRGAHAPGESVDILSVDRSWHLLKAILAAVS